VREIVAEGFLSSFPPANGCSVTQLIFYYVITARICYNDFYEKAGKGCVHWAQFRVRQSSVLELLSLGLGMKSWWNANIEIMLRSSTTSDPNSLSSS
jgi:hypothetical protein